MQGGDSRQIGWLDVVSDLAATVGAQPPVSAPIAAVGRLLPVRLGVLCVLGHVVGIIVAIAVVSRVWLVVAMVIFDQAEIDRHLAHRAGHRQSSVIPSVTASAGL